MHLLNIAHSDDKPNFHGDKILIPLSKVLDGLHQFISWYIPLRFHIGLIESIICLSLALLILSAGREMYIEIDILHLQ